MFNLDEWHDSYVWDQVRLKYLKDKPQYKLCPDGHVGHVWSMHSVIKDYIGHMKGKTLKNEKLIKFENNNEYLFSILKNCDLVKILNKGLSLLNISLL